MITVKFKENQKEKTLSLEISGHAGYSDPGKDIVCSAASILAYALAQEVVHCYEDHCLTKEPEISLEEGNTLITCAPIRKAIDDVYLIFRFALTGYKLLSQNYPDNVTLVWEAAEQL